MKRAKFEEVVDAQLSKIAALLCSKGDEYVHSEDRLHNFAKGAKFRGKPMEEILWGMVLKHFIALDDFVTGVTKEHPCRVPIAQWEEKITDIQTYLMLLLAIRYKTELQARGTDTQSKRCKVCGEKAGFHRYDCKEAGNGIEREVGRTGGLDRLHSVGPLWEQGAQSSPSVKECCKTSASPSDARYPSASRAAGGSSSADKG